MDVLTPNSFLVQRPVVLSDLEREAKGGFWIASRCLRGSPPERFWNPILVISLKTGRALSTSRNLVLGGSIVDREMPSPG